MKSSKIPKAMKVTLILILVLFVLWMLWGWLSVRNVEEPKYTVIESTEVYELRKYDPVIIAKTTVEGTRDEATNEGFRQIADYIFGNNTVKESIAMTTPVTSQGSEKIAMTAPVTSAQDESGSFTTAFVMPSQYTMETLPKPVTDYVKIEEVPEKTYAVFSFSGYVWDAKVQNNLDELMKALETTDLNFEDSYTLSQYNPPWTPWFMRRNEIWVEVDM